MAKFLLRHRCIKICLLAFFSFVTAFISLSTEAYLVQVDGQGQLIQAYSWQSVPDIVREAGVALKEGDRLTLDSKHISVVRAAKIKVFTDNGVLSLLTSEPTIAKSLAQAGINTAGRLVFPDKATKPTDGLTVVLLKTNEKLLEETAKIPYQTISKPDSHIELGATTTIKDGHDGQKSILSKLVALADGGVTREVLAERIIIKPEDKVVAMGTASTIATSRGNLRFSKVLNMEATAYTPWDEGCIGITKSGIPATRGVVAVDPNVIALGTRLYIPGYGMALAADTGGAIIGNRIDLCMETTDEAFAYGRRNSKVYILE